MKPQLEILPEPQRRLWPELVQVPGHFVLYGGTAIALRLGGRQSLDFDFFTDRAVSADALAQRLEFLNGAALLQAEPNTATFAVERDGEIKVSFFGGLSFGRIAEPDFCDDNGVAVASLLDLAAQKLKVILARAEPKDYLDIVTLLKAGVDLAQALGAARALYPELNPILSLKALAYYGEPALTVLPKPVTEFLTAAVTAVEEVPRMVKVNQSIAPAKAADPPHRGIRP